MRRFVVFVFRTLSFGKPFWWDSRTMVANGSASRRASKPPMCPVAPVTVRAGKVHDEASDGCVSWSMAYVPGSGVHVEEHFSAAVRAYRDRCWVDFSGHRIVVVECFANDRLGRPDLPRAGGVRHW